MHAEAKDKLKSQDKDLLTPFLNAAVEKVVVFNVGQGNGIIVVTNLAYWIVDFGSDGPPTTYSK